MGGRGEQQRMAHDGTRRGRIQPQPACSRGRQPERHVDVAAPMRMIVYAHAVEPRVLAPRDEVDDAGDRHAHGHPKVDLHAVAYRPGPGPPSRPSARSTRSGVMGWSEISAPNGASASLTALRMAAGAPVVPASPAPLKPPAIDGAGVSRWWSSNAGRSAAVGTA